MKKIVSDPPNASQLTHIPCGSGLAHDGIGAVYQKIRIACIAGKPAPTGFSLYLKQRSLN